jgi:osmotically-inducible protein OsmY
LPLYGCVSTAITGANVVYNRNSLEKTASDYYLSLSIEHNIDTSSQIAIPHSIDVTTFHRVVLLTGEVPNDNAQQTAINIAKNTPHVIRVFNALTIGPPLSAAAAAIDTWITTKIKAKLIANNGIDPSKIKVVTENRVVYLMGVIPHDQADIATDLASHTDGVNRVVKIFYYVIMPKIS